MVDEILYQTFSSQSHFLMMAPQKIMGRCDDPGGILPAEGVFVAGSPTRPRSCAIPSPQLFYCEDDSALSNESEGSKRLLGKLPLVWGG